MEKQNSHKLTRAYSFIFFGLSLFVGFFTGGFYVVITGAAEGQGLAAGAIAAVYAMSFAFIAVLLSVLLAYYLPKKTILIFNWILLILLLIHIAIITHRFIERNQADTLSQVITGVLKQRPSVYI